MENNQNLSSETVGSPNTNKIVSLIFKYILLVLLVATPFIGGWIGYKYAPEKLVEIEQIVVKEISVNSEMEGANQKRLLPMDSWGTPTRTTKIGHLAVSPNGENTYFVQFSYEGSCCSRLNMATNASPDNSFDAIIEYQTIEEAGPIKMQRWPVSPDGKYMVVSTYSEEAQTLCTPGMAYIPERANNIVKVINLDTSEVMELVSDEPNVNYRLGDWSADSTSISVSKVTMQTRTKADDPDNELYTLTPCADDYANPLSSEEIEMEVVET